MSHESALRRAAGLPPEFLTETGEVAGLMRAVDWSKTALGPIETWSASLRMMVSFLLANRFPLLLWWGPDYVSIYNDAYGPILGAKHPWALGKPVKECWSEIWDFLKPLIDAPFTGGPSTWMDDMELQLQRKGYTEETHFTVAYSPVPDETAPRGIGGVLATVHEITENVVGERRLKVLRDLGAVASDAKSGEEACAVACAALAMHPKDVPFALLYLLSADGEHAHLAGACGVEIGASISPEVIHLVETAAAWPLSQCKITEQIQVVENLGALVDSVPAGPWPDPPHTAVILPIQSNLAHQFAGFFVAGVSSRLKFDSAYENFLQLATTQVATVIANACAFEEAKKRAAALAELDRAKTAFFSNVSHEFRTPLTLMLGPLEDLMTLQGSIPARAQESLGIAHRNSLRLLRLVNTLLDFSRIEAGRVQASFQPTDLATFTSELASIFRSAMERAGLQFVVHCPPLSQVVHVDREMWEKVVLNFVSNAFKYTFQGAVTVQLDEVDGRAVLSVADTGTGIPEQALPLIFDRFHRVEGARGRTVEGSGIGLALVAELVKLHGGHVDVESRFGEGSTFTASVPFGTAHLPPDRVGGTPSSTAIRSESYLEEALRWLPPESGVPQSLNGGSSEITADQLSKPSREGRASAGRVLVADDNTDMLGYVSGLLGAYYQVETATNGAAALRSAEKRPPDLILTDVMMPELDGFALLRALRTNPRTSSIPVILLSARAGEESRSEGMDAGADDYLVKPFSARELLARVGAHLRLARARNDAEEGRRKSEERLSFALQAGGGVGTWDWDIPNDLVYSDAKFAAFFSIDPQRAATGTPIADYVARIHPDDRSRVEAHIQRALKTDADFLDEYRVVRADGTECWLQARGRCHRDEAGKPFRFPGVAFDISDQKKIEKDLRHANIDLQQFAFAAAHDLQEPLRMVTSYTQLLSRKLAGGLDEGGREYMNQVVGGAKRMSALLHDLLAYTDASRDQDGDRTAVDLNSVFVNVVSNLHDRIRKNGATVEAERLPIVLGNQMHFVQLFQNLISNSLKYRGEVPPEVHISAERNAREWTLRFRDNGVGIPLEHQDRVFGVFKRLHGKEIPGTGIGLAICQRVVERHGGRLWVESKGNGQGSTFCFTLPVLRPG